MPDTIPTWDDTVPVHNDNAPQWDNTIPVAQVSPDNSAWGMIKTAAKKAVSAVEATINPAAAVQKLTGPTGQAITEHLPEIGATAGMAGGVAGSALGAAGGQALKEAAQAATGAEGTPQSALSAGGQPILQGGLQVAGGKIMDKIAEFGPKIINSVSEFAKPAVAQIMKAMEGIDERTATRVLTDPHILLRAKPIKVAQKELGQFIDESGYKYGPEALEKVTGDIKVSEQKATDLANAVIKKIEAVSGDITEGMTPLEKTQFAHTTRGTISEGKTKISEMPENAEFMHGLTQEALAAQKAIGKFALNEAKNGDAQTARYLWGKQSQVDDFIDSQMPGYLEMKQMYSEARVADEFKRFLPVNKNGQVSVLRAFANAANIIRNPESGVATTILSSPYAAGFALKGAAMAKPVISKVEESGAPRAATVLGISRLRTDKVNQQEESK